MCYFAELQLNTDVEKEENRLLREQIDNLKKETLEQTRSLTEEVEKVRTNLNPKVNTPLFVAAVTAVSRQLQGFNKYFLF